MPGAQLRINGHHVVHETIDGETIVIHLETGAYYSLDGPGAIVWELLVAGGGDAEEIIACTQTRYDTDPQSVVRPISALIDELLSEGLIVKGQSERAPSAPASDEMLSTSTPPGAPGEMAFASCDQFVAPILHKYTDMQEFMLVDPLHDVEQDAGWPHLKDG